MKSVEANRIRIIHTRQGRRQVLDFLLLVGVGVGGASGGGLRGVSLFVSILPLFFTPPQLFGGGGLSPQSPPLPTPMLEAQLNIP